MGLSKIQWTDFVFNPWSGCTKVSAGCANCYAEVNYSVKVRGVKWGPSGNRIVKAESGWKEPLAWDRAAATAGERHRVFCASLADVFEDWKGPLLASCGTILGPDFRAAHGKGRLAMDDVRTRLFKLIDATPNLDWLLLTKRPENVLRMVYDRWAVKVPGHVQQNEGDGRRWKFPSNVWLGVSIEDQPNADKRIPALLNIPAAVRFVSYEPALGPVSYIQKFSDGATHNWLTGQFHGLNCTGNDGSKFTVETTDKNLPRIAWVIVGGESGPDARPCNTGWLLSTVKQCKDAGTACFVKQLGSEPRPSPLPSHVSVRFVKDKKGGDIKEWPQDLRVREMPK